MLDKLLITFIILSFVVITTMKSIGEYRDTWYQNTLTILAMIFIPGSIILVLIKIWSS